MLSGGKNHPVARDPGLGGIQGYELTGGFGRLTQIFTVHIKN